MAMRKCILCNEEYDPHGLLKKRVGGLITHCPACAEEKVVKYLGVMHADGKQAGCEVLAFGSLAERAKFHASYSRNIGMNKGKVCPLGQAGNTSGIAFKKVASFDANVNHKGKS